MAHEMSDEELQRRRHLQGKIGRTTSTLGLTGVGLLGTAIGMKKSPAFEAKVMRTPGLRRLATPKPLKIGQKPRYPGRAPQTPEDRTRETAQNVGIVAGGIGGVGGFNQAAIYSAESRKKKVSKAVATWTDDYDIAPTYGEISKKILDTEEKKRGAMYGAVGGIFHAPGAAIGAAAAAPSGQKLNGAAAGAVGGFVGGPIGGGVAGHYAGSLHKKGHLKKVKNKKQIAKASAFGVTHD